MALVLPKISKLISETNGNGSFIDGEFNFLNILSDNTRKTFRKTIYAKSTSRKERPGHRRFPAVLVELSPSNLQHGEPA